MSNRIFLYLNMLKRYQKQNLLLILFFFFFLNNFAEHTVPLVNAKLVHAFSSMEMFLE